MLENPYSLLRTESRMMERFGNIILQKFALGNLTTSDLMKSLYVRSSHEITNELIKKAIVTRQSPALIWNLHFAVLDKCGMNAAIIEQEYLEAIDVFINKDNITSAAKYAIRHKKYGSLKHLLKRDHEMNKDNVYKEAIIQEDHTALEILRVWITAVSHITYCAFANRINKRGLIAYF